MKKLFVVIAALASSAPALAQEARPKLGVGVALNALGSPDFAPTVEVYVPLKVAPNIRVEPSLGIRTVDSPAGGTDERDVTIGVGVFALKKVAAPVDLYLGGRLKLDFAKVTDGAGVSDSGTDMSLAAAVGGEDFLAPRFSIGLEAQLGYYSNSSASRFGEADGFFTTGLVFLRVYL